MKDEDILKVFEEAGMRIEFGAQFSVRGQIAQLLNGVNALMPSDKFAKREYKVCYVENGKKHLCGHADSIEEAEKLRTERAETFAPLEVLILERETVCREIRYT
jgi:hypothetical protein